MKSLLRSFSRIPAKIMKLIEYSQLLWSDEDWDWAYIVIMLRYKIKRTRDCIDRNQIIADEERHDILRQMDLVIKLLDRVERDKYCDFLERAIVTEHGENFHQYFRRDGGCLYEIMYGKGPDDYDSKYTEKERELLLHRYLAANRAAGRMKSRDLERAFRVTGKYIQYWWD
jgi:hypothetical protein